MRKSERRRLTADGLPVDAREYTPEMWAIIHRHLTAMREELREEYARHLQTRDGSEAASLYGAELPRNRGG